MGVILAKFRKEKSTEAVLEDLKQKIDELETFTLNTQERKKRIVGNFLAVSIGVYVIAFVLFYFAYFPPTWKDRIIYCIPLLLFPIIIIQLRYLFTWYFQRKLNKNSKKLTALRDEKKKILEQVMDKETYKVAVNLLARFADKPSKPSLALATATPNTSSQLLNRSLPNQNFGQQRSQQMNLTSTPTPRITSNYLSTPRLTSRIDTSSSPAMTLLAPQSIRNNQQLRRRTPFPIVNQQEKGVFDRIVDVLIGDGPQDRFAMICKDCYSHNGMALKDDFEYTTFRCAFCNALNPARKTRPVAPRLSLMAPPDRATASSDTSDSDDDKGDSGNEPSINLNADITQFSTPKHNLENGANENITAAPFSSSSSDMDEEEHEAKIQPQSAELPNKENLELKENSSLDELLKQLEKSDSAIEDTSMSLE